MMKWLSQHAATVEAGAAAIMALIALAALIGVKYQLDATDSLQRSQSARDAYRSHLALATTKSEFAKPHDACELASGENAGAYTAFVDHLLYSAEQMLQVEPGWEATFKEALVPHAPYMCSANAPTGSTIEMLEFLKEFKKSSCKVDVACR